MQPATTARETADIFQGETLDKASSAARSAGSDYPLLLKQCLLNVVDQAGDNEIVYRGEVRLTYTDLLARISRLGSALRAMGIGPGDTVAVMEWDTHRYLECFFAIPMLGAVIQTVNVRLSRDQIRYTLDHAGARLILSHTDFLPLIEEIVGDLPRVEGVVHLRDGCKTADQPWIKAEYESLLADGVTDFVFPDFDEDTRATTFYTSGTTGLPKGVFYSHRQLVLHALSTLAVLALGDRYGRFSRDTVYMPITPMFHAHAWGIPFVATLAGCKQVYPGRYVPEELIELYRAEKVTFSHCVPTLLQMMLTSAASEEVDFSGWQVLVGGSALSSGLARLAADRGVVLTTGYGMSETGPMVSLTRIKPESIGSDLDEIRLRTKVGMVVPLVELRIVDEEMRDVPRDGVSAGEIVLRSPWLTRGYHRDPAASADLWRGGYLHTQDLGRLDRHGYLQISDRLKDVIKTGGEWVSSLTMEDLISRHPAVLESAVIAVADERWGERPGAVVVLKPGARATPEDIRRHLSAFAAAGEIPRYAVPDRLWFTDALDRTSVGKIDKKALRARFLEQRPRPEDL